MLIKFTDENLQTHRNGRTQQYAIGEWVKPVDGMQARKADGACGPGSLHLMKHMRPSYAPHPYLANEAEGKRLIAEDQEKARFKQVWLVRTLTDAEIDQAMDDDWAARLGQSGLFLPISWARTATFLDRPVDRAALTPKLEAVAAMLGKPQAVSWSPRYLLGYSLRYSLGYSLRYSLGASLTDLLDCSLRYSLGCSVGDSLRYSLGYSVGDSLKASLGASLGASLVYERGFMLAGSSKPELAGLLDVWKAGACPLGWSNGKFIVMDGGRNEPQ